MMVKIYLRSPLNATQQPPKPLPQSTVENGTASTNPRDGSQIKEKKKARRGDGDVLLLDLRRKTDEDRVEKRTHSETQRESAQSQPGRALAVPKEPERNHRKQTTRQRPEVQRLECLAAPDESAREQAAESVPYERWDEEHASLRSGSQRRDLEVDWDVDHERIKSDGLEEDEQVMFEDDRLGGELEREDGFGGAAGEGDVGGAAGGRGAGEDGDPVGSPGDARAAEIEDEADG